jgi:polar amino acid transport system substrate-binding protein
MLQSTRDRTKPLLPLVMAVVASLIITACGGAPTPAATSPSTPATAAASATAKPPVLNPPAVLTAGQLACSLDFGAPPNQFQDAAGTAQGINPDIMLAIGKELGVTIKFENLPFGTQIAGLQAKRYDAMCTSAIIRPDRLEVMYMIPYVQWGRAMIARADDPNAISCTAGDFDGCIAKLSGKTVLTGTGSIEHTDLKDWSDKFVSQGRAPITIQAFENQGQAAAALARGVGDVSYHEDHQVAYFQQQFPNKFKVLMQKYLVSPVALTVRKEPAAIPLADAIVFALDRMKANGTYQAILTKWNMTAATTFQYQK